MRSQRFENYYYRCGTCKSTSGFFCEFDVNSFLFGARVRVARAQMIAMCAARNDHENKQVVVTTPVTRDAKLDDFHVRVAPLPTLNRGDVLVRAMYLSIDP